MLQRSSLNYAVKSLLILVLFCCGVQVALCQTSSKDVWKDSATGLTWAVKDNGESVNVAQAGNYCAGLKAGGFSNWRLPTIDELSDLYDKAAKKTFKTKGPIEMSDSCALSGSTNPAGEIWSFCFSYGGKSLVRATGHGSAGRALCVRSAE